MSKGINKRNEEKLKVYLAKVKKEEGDKKKDVSVTKKTKGIDPK